MRFWVQTVSRQEIDWDWANLLRDTLGLLITAKRTYYTSFLISKWSLTLGSVFPGLQTIVPNKLVHRSFLKHAVKQFIGLISSFPRKSFLKQGSHDDTSGLKRAEKDDLSYFLSST